MNSEGIAITMVYPIMKTIVYKGFDTERFFQYASFDPALLKDVEARIPGEQLERLMNCAAEYTKDDYFGLQQGQITEFADMGILGYVMMHSNTVAEAIAAYQRYNVILCSGFNIDWEVQGEEVRIRMFTDQRGRMSRHCTEDMASSLYRLLCRLSNHNIQLTSVHFVHAAPYNMGPYVSAFGCTPLFAQQENMLVMSKQVLDYSIMYSDARLLEVFENIAQKTKEELVGGSLFSEQVSQYMKKCMPSCFPTLQQTSEYFGMSTRTLQKKLKEENTTYNDLSTQVRKALAMRYLKQETFSVGEIAYVLHFSEPSAFQSAFKKWTGVTPGQYRASLQKDLKSDSGETAAASQTLAKLAEQLNQSVSTFKI